jgi:hypothetical protein
MKPFTVDSSTLRSIVMETNHNSWSSWLRLDPVVLWRGQAFLHPCDEHRRRGARSCDFLVQYHEGDVLTPQPAATAPSTFSAAVLDHKFIIT